MSVAVRIRRLVGRGYRRAFPPGEDPARDWLNAQAGQRGDVRIAHFGDCVHKTMDGPHSSYTPAGYLRRVTEVAREDGIEIRVSSTFTEGYAGLPAAADDVDRHYRLAEDPDLVILHTGTVYLLRRILPNVRPVVMLRHDLGIKAGRLLHPSYRCVVHPLLRAAGKPYRSYPGQSPVREFVAATRARWSDARILIITPHAVLCDGVHDPAAARALADDLGQLTRELGVEQLDLRDAVGDLPPQAYCVNGYNLGAHGQEAVARALADWMRTAGLLGGRRPRSTRR